MLYPAKHKSPPEVRPPLPSPGETMAWHFEVADPYQGYGQLAIKLRGREDVT